MKKFGAFSTKILSIFGSFLLLALASCANSAGAYPVGSDEANSSSGGGVVASGNLSNGALTTGRNSVTAPSAAGAITLYKNNSSLGSKDSIAAALAEIPQSGSDDYKITLAKGTYSEGGLTYKGSNTVKIIGLGSAEYGLDVLIYGQGTDMSQESKRSTLSFQGSANVVLENITVQNSYGTTEGTAQAEALGLGPSAFSGTLVAHNCSFLSGQDTICTEGKAWFYKCYVEGDVDFIWMESRSGKVALYEECVIRAIGTRTTSAYFTAPRLANSDSVWKGVVIWNSVLEAESGLKKVYLGRNPWHKDTQYYNDYYENVAIVGSSYYGPALDGAIWKTAARGTSNQQYVGFKTDSAFPDSTSGYGARLTSSQVSAEYSSRTCILNRYYSISASSFENDTDAWDTSDLAVEFGASDSGTLPANVFDATKAKVVWDFAGTLNGSSTSQFNSSSGTIDGTVSGSSDYTVKMHVNASNGKLAARSANGDTQFNAGTILTVPVTNGATVSVTKTGGSFGIEGASTATYTHSGSATGVIIHSSTAYITEVAISNLDLTALSSDLLNATATGKVRVVTVSAAGDEVEVNGSLTLTASAYASYGASPSAFTWASSNPSTASVASSTSSSCAVTGKAEGSATITVSCGEKSASKTLTVKPASTSTVVDVATWDWKGNSASINYFTDSALTTVSNGLNGKTGYVTGTSTKVALYVSTAGKLTTNGNNNGAQFNSPTVIQVPVSNGSVVTVTAYAGNYYQSIKFAGSQMTAQTGTYTATAAGYVEVEATANTYLNSISVTNVDTADSHTTNVASSGSSGGIDETVVSTNTFFDLRSLLSSCSTVGAASTGTSGKLAYAAMYYKDNQHGAWFYNSSVVSFKVSGACTIYLGKDQYSGTTFSVSDGTNTQTLNNNASSTLGANVTSDMSSDSENPSFSYSGSGEATITISVTGSSGQNFLPAIQVKF